MWFDILKNEMRTVNLPKFKVKPFDVNKPDEDKDDCKDRMFALQNKIKNTPLYDDNSIFDKVRDKGNRGGTEYYRIIREPSPTGYNELRGPDHFVSQFYLYPMTGTNVETKGVKNKNHFEITVEESRYIMNKQAEKIPEEVYCRALDLIAQVSTVVNGGMFIKDPYRVGDWEIHYDPREYNGAGNLEFNEWGGVSKRKGLHIHSEKYPYEFHMSNSIAVFIDDYGDMPVEEYGLDVAIKEILDHYKKIEIKWN
tara:strand:+ start:3489 stop:4247 length:759 start_codon:yes stop_codon:yes gene_type:complete